MIRRLLITALAATAPWAAQAVTLEFPGAATRTAQEVTPLSSYALPMSPWKNGTLDTLPAEGEVIKQAWQVQGDGLTTLQILSPLREQLSADGYEMLFECQDSDCGGFDFRYANKVLPEPAMHVDLGDFRVLTARKMGATASEYVCLLVSRSSARGYVQIVHVAPPSETGEPLVATSTKTPDAATAQPAPAGPLAEQLDTLGRAVLEDVQFATGTSQLGAEEFASLTALADYLLTHPDRKVMLVGHTDAVGSLAGNVALSKKRAQSVARHLTDALGVPAHQVSADGAGYLAPIATNLTDDGREKNRRVEVILTSLD